MSEIHNVPVLPVEWPSRKVDGELVTDGTQDVKLSQLVSSLLDSYPKKWNKVTKQHESWLEEELERRNSQYPPYQKLPTSAKIEKTSKFLASLSFDTKEYSSLLARQHTLIYKMDMTPDKCRREDPYTGTQFIYDYGWLREGPRPVDRNTNLLIHVPKVTIKRWKEANPNDPQRKSSNWYLTADGIVLKDGIILIAQT
jgi:RNA:NAD 2'-phosphotransferase (TPT1/KptA family)